MSVGNSHIDNFFHVAILCSTLSLIPNQNHIQVVFISSLLCIYFGYSIIAKKTFTVFNLTFILFALLLQMIVSSIFATIPTFSWYVTNCWCLTFLFWFYLRMNKTVEFEQQILAIIKVLFLSTIVFTCYTFLIQIIEDKNYFPRIDKFQIVHFFRRTENYLSSYLVLLLPFALAKSNFKSLDTLMWIGVIPSAYILLSGISQSNIVLAILMLFAFLVHFKSSLKQGKKLFPIYVLAFLFICITIGFQIKSGNRIQFISEYHGLNERFVIWTHSLQLFLDNLALGTGFGNWMVHIEQYHDIRTKIVHPHNLFIEIATELGLMGICLFLYFFGSILSKSITRIKQLTQIEYAALISILFYLVDSSLYGTINHQYMAYSGISFLAILCLSILLKSSESKKSNLLKYFIFCLSLVSLVYSSYIYFKNNQYSNLRTVKTKEGRYKFLEYINNDILYSHSTKHNSLAKILHDKSEEGSTKKLHYFEKIIHQNPYNETYIIKLAEILKSNGDYEKSLEYYNRLTNTTLEEDLRLQLNIAELYYLTGKRSQAEDIIFAIKDLPIPSFQQDQSGKIKDIIKIKTDAFSLHTKYNK